MLPTHTLVKNTYVVLNSLAVAEYNKIVYEMKNDTYCISFPKLLRIKFQYFITE